MSVVLDQLPSQLYWQILRRRSMVYVAFVAPWIILASPIGIAVASALLVVEALFLWRQTKRHYVTWLDAQFPELEDSTRLLSEPDKQTALASLQRARLATRLSHLITPTSLRQLASTVLAWQRVYLALSWALAALVFAFQPAVTVPAKIAMPLPAPQHGLSALQMHVSPPAYTQIAAFQSEAKAMQVPEHSQIRWCILQPLQPQELQTQSQAQSIRLSNGQELNFVQTGSQVCAEWQASETVFWTWSADVKQERFTVTVQLDQEPEISLKEPLELLQVLATNANSVAMQVQVRDDYQVTNASLHLTLARGSGENIRFSDKEVPLPQGADKRRRDWQKRWSLSELGMEPGDELYFFVRATDNAANNPHVVRSPTYTIRLPAPDAVEDELSVLPVLAKPESLRSQRQIIIDTEQLVADIAANPKLSPSLIRNRSEVIANDQAALRRRYGRFLGEESSLFGDEHADDDHANEKPGTDWAAQYGHAHDQEENATLFDEATKKILRRALVAMWDAEKSLRAITPKAALPAENKALEAIKQLQQADRIYLHKAAFTPPAIKEEKRLSGDVLEVRSQLRNQAEWEDPVTTSLKELLQALGTGAALPALWMPEARAFIAQQLPVDSQRLQAQAAVQDVADGCQPCRAVLAAWLRQGIQADTMRLQARPVFTPKKPSQFEQRWESSRPTNLPSKREAQ
ncbi:hypothetical protein H8K52_11540 [Undibacterium seohonense]|uniref:DUF4175 domain-containing protein n=1 Tax=Undibacterium seohonense TaxID=1344950 RepID=A0ABR6X4W2_9BURK|nr:DUF4175 family protein [Undibacterium seohonense]MBC3807979.1 hypothetical protein [Undibacterium seohonense]